MHVGVTSIPPQCLGYYHFARTPLYFVEGCLYYTPPSESERDLFQVQADTTEIKAELRATATEIKTELHATTTELKTDLRATNQRIDSLSESVNKRIDDLKDSLASAKIWAFGLYVALAGSLFYVLARGFKWI